MHKHPLERDWIGCAILILITSPAYNWWSPSSFADFQHRGCFELEFQPLSCMNKPFGADRQRISNLTKMIEKSENVCLELNCSRPAKRQMMDGCSEFCISTWNGWSPWILYFNLCVLTWSHTIYNRSCWILSYHDSIHEWVGNEKSVYIFIFMFQGNEEEET